MQTQRGMLRHPGSKKVWPSSKIRTCWADEGKRVMLALGRGHLVTWALKSRRWGRFKLGCGNSCFQSMCLCYKMQIAFVKVLGHKGPPSFIFFCKSFFSIFSEVQFTCHTLYPFKTYDSVAFGIFIKSCIHHYSQC